LNLKELREKMGLTQTQVAERMRVTQGYISQLEKKASVSYSALAKYLGAMGGSVVIKCKLGESEWEESL
jgi:transcriptional regulator with XRE-family HTH domain